MVITTKLTRRPSGTAVVAAVLMGGVAVFQIALVAGAPWGAAAWGGASPGTLPAGLRVASAGSALVYAFLAVAAGTALVPPRRRRGILTVASGAMALGTAMNLASPSDVERALWTPVAGVLAVLLWRARSDGDRHPD